MSSNFLPLIQGIWKCKNCGCIDWKWEIGRENTMGTTRLAGVCMDCFSRVVVAQNKRSPLTPIIVDYKRAVKWTRLAATKSVTEHAFLSDFLYSVSPKKHAVDDALPYQGGYD